MEHLVKAMFAVGAPAAGGGATTTITNGLNDACSNNACNTGSTLGGILGNVANVLIYLVGAVAVIMIIIGGLRYVTSNGDAKQAESARNTVLYASIGLVVAGAAYAVVLFVLKIK